MLLLALMSTNAFSCDLRVSDFGFTYTEFTQQLDQNGEMYIKPDEIKDIDLDLTGHQVCGPNSPLINAFLRYRFIDDSLSLIDVVINSSGKTVLFEYLSRAYGEAQRSRFMSFSNDFDAAFWLKATYSISYRSKRVGNAWRESARITSNYTVDELSKQSNERELEATQ